MNFTSFHFLGFFIVTIILGHLLKNRSQRIFLLAASYYFYGVFEPWYLFLLFFSTILDYLAALGIETRRSGVEGIGKTDRLGQFMALLTPRAWLIISLAMNLGLLGYFKYSNFGIEVVNDLNPYGGSIYGIPTINILLPIGISFYTFQSMSYTIDVYRGVLKARRDIVDFALYVTFFPQLVAGPIVRATTFLEQLDNRLGVKKDDIIVGVTRIVVGFFRKLVLADNLALLTAPVFANPEHYGVFDIWLGSVAFGIQIYLDFAGYTDIARGVARLFGFEFDINFLYPFARGNITEHWKQWHISLTTWLRDYVFIPLGGSRVSPGRLYLNVFILWFLTGIWHGSAYHYIAWGVWQGVLQMVHRAYTTTRLHGLMNSKGGIPYQIFSRVLLLFSLNFGFIWFRAPNMRVATYMQGRLFGIHDLPLAAERFWYFLTKGEAWSAVTQAMHPSAVINGVTHYLPLPGSAMSKFGWLLAFFFLYEFLFYRLQLEYFWKQENKGKLIFMMIFMILCVMVFSTPENPTFLYFQF